MLSLRVSVCILLFSSVVFAGKAKSRKDRSSSSSHGIDTAPAERSLDDWQKLSLEVLKLACNPIHLIDSGSRLVLDDLYHPQLEAPSAPS